jgi:hypothetical protein
MPLAEMQAGVCTECTYLINLTLFQQSSTSITLDIMSQAPTGSCITWVHGTQKIWDEKDYILGDHSVVTQCPITEIGGECDHLTNDLQRATYVPTTKTLYGIREDGEKWAIKMRSGYAKHEPHEKPLPGDCPFDTTDRVTVFVSQNGWVKTSYPPDDDPEGDFEKICSNFQSRRQCGTGGRYQGLQEEAEK